MSESLRLDDYLSKYGALLGMQAQAALDPLHVPGRDPVRLPALLRKPYPAQQHAIMAVVAAMRNQKGVMLVSACGTGKSLMASVAIHAHAAGRPYRALVMCPGQLVAKWPREIVNTIPGAKVCVIDDWRNLVWLKERRTLPAAPLWYVIARDRAKLGSGIEAAYWKHRGTVRCPRCGNTLVDQKGNLVLPEKMTQRWAFCEWSLTPDERVIDGCGERLWQMVRKPDRYEPARYIHKHLRGYFDYLVGDESHQMKGDDTAQANAFGSLIASARKVIALTGTLIGGYANHVRSIMFRMCPQSLVSEGLTWKEATKFSELYGRIETKIVQKSGDNDDEGTSNRQSRGSNKTVTKYVRPGIMPTLFGRHLMKSCVFLSLEEISDDLPPLNEKTIAVPLDGELVKEYPKVETALKNAIKEMLARGDRRLLGTMLQVLLAYPDYPFHWDEVGYKDGDDGWIKVCEPKNLDPDAVSAKEQALIDLVKSEVAQGRQCWVYAVFTDKRDVQSRIQRQLEKSGLKVGSLRAAIPLAKREEWIEKQGRTVDVCISHPQLVETGLDLFSIRPDGHNYPTLIAYETGYNLFTLRQAMSRSWRLGQRTECRSYYIYWAGTMQERAMTLMGRKMVASMAIEGRFSSDGLAALADDTGSMEMAMARSLADQMNDLDAGRAWEKLTTTRMQSPTPVVEVSREMALIERRRKRAIELHPELAADFARPSSTASLTELLARIMKHAE